MGQAQQIIERILAESAARRSSRERSVLSSGPYRDEPIIVTGSQMASYLPERYREMRALERRPDARFKSEAQLFREQAALMADWEDDFPTPAPLERYYPTFRIMSNRQLRTYFAWRTKVRRGQVEETSLSYAFVHLYELVNCVGAPSPEAAFEQLDAFRRAYRDIAPEIDRYARRWLRDLAVYHGLDRALLDHAIGLEAQTAIEVLQSAATATNDELFDALANRSSYRILSSKLYRERPATVKRTLCAVYRTLDAYFRRKRTTSLADNLFGTPVTRPYIMFESAMFHDEANREDRRSYTYDLGGGESFSCENGYWSHTYRRHAGRRSARLGAIAKAVDASLRQATGFGSELKAAGAPKYVEALVEKEVRTQLAWERAHTVPAIHIDPRKLAGIRTAAAQTREALLTDEERDAPADDAPAPPVEIARQAPGEPAPQAPAGATGPLSPKEAAYLAALAEQDRTRAARIAGGPEDMLVDAVNEKLFDLVGDTVVEFAGAGPCVVEDYLEDVKGLLGI